MQIKKWWGENAAEFVQSPQNIVNDFNKWLKQVVVVSAIRSPEYNTTDKLIELWKELTYPEIDKTSVLSKIESIRDFHLEMLDVKIPWGNYEIKKNIIKIFYELSFSIFYWINREDKIYPSKENDYLINTQNWDLSIIWFWEILSAKIQELLVNKLWVKWLEAEVLDMDSITSWIDKIDKKNKEERKLEIFEKLSEEIAVRINKILDRNRIPILPWYIPGFEEWIEEAIWRWYTDATASMAAVGLSKYWEQVVLEIQKSVLWILSADPRIVTSWTKLIKELNYITAKEITWARWAQAKLLHSQVLRKELQESWINVHLFDPFSDSDWTLITKNKNNKTSWVEYIWWRKNIIVFTVSSWKMSWTWILSSVFEIVKDYTPVDIVWTSETEITFTIDLSLSKEKLDDMTFKIKEALWIKENNDEDFVEYENSKALIYCIWQNMRNSPWILWKAAQALWKWNIDIEIISQWRLQRAFVFCIDESKMEEGIQLLHDELIW